MDKDKKKEENTIDRGLTILSTFFDADEEKFLPPDYGDYIAPERIEELQHKPVDANK